MWRYSLTAIIALGLFWVGASAIARGQIAIGIVFVAIAVLRLAAVAWSRRPRKPQPSIRLNLDGEEDPKG
jgi:hypothetical protein